MTANYINEALDHQDMKLDQLQMTVRGLTQDLNGVLRSSSNKVLVPEEHNDRETICPVLDRLNDYNYRLTEIISLVNEIREGIMIGSTDTDLPIKEPYGLAQ